MESEEAKTEPDQTQEEINGSATGRKFTYFKYEMFSKKSLLHWKI